MPRAANRTDESHDLRRLMRDVVALTSLPAVWLDYTPEQIARSLAEVLSEDLALDLFYVCLRDRSGATVVDFAYSRHRPGAESLPEIAETVSPWRDACATDETPTIENPFGEGTLRLALIPFGGAAESGVMVAGARRPEFPRETDRLLLGVSANQAATVMQRNRVARMLEEQREQFRITLASIGDAVITLDVKGCIATLNPIAETMTGWTQQQAAGRQFEEVVCRLSEDGQPAGNIVQSIARGDEPASHVRPVRLVARDGSLRPMEEKAAPIRNSTGDVVGVVLTLRDVTDRKQAEELLRASEERYRSVTKVITSIVWTSDDQGRFVTPQPAWSDYTGQDWEQQRDFGWSDALHPEDRDRVLETWRAASSAKALYKSAGRLWHAPSKSYRHFEARAVPIANADGTLREWVGTCIDVEDRWQADERARYQSDLVHSITKNATTAIFMIDNTSRCTFMNPAAEAMTGYYFEEARGRVLHELIHHHYPDGSPYPIAECPIDHALPEKLEVRDREDVFFRKNGEPFPVMCNARPLAKKGVPVGTVIEVRDITREKQADEWLRQSERRFRWLAEAMPQMVWICDAEGHVNYFNRRWYEYTGQQLEEAFGCGWLEVLHPDDRSRCDTIWQQAVQSGSTFEAEARYRRWDGEHRWFLVRAVAVQQEGQVRSWFATSTDIDDTKRSEQAARFLSEASAALADLSDLDGTLQHIAGAAVPLFADWCVVDMLDDQSRRRRVAIRHQDPEKLCVARELEERYPPRPEDGYGISNVLRTGEAELATDIEDSVLASVAHNDEHLELLRALDLKSYLCVPIRSHGKTLGAISFVSDQTDRRYREADLRVAQDVADRASVAIENVKLYRALQEADRRKDEFLATLAHELRNPLAPIRTGTELMRLAKDDPITLEEVRETIERQTDQLVTLVDDLLDVSRITRGKLELRKCHVELDDVIRSAVEASRPAIDDARHALSVDVPAEPIQMEADRHRLAQIISNLLNNAAKYTPAGGRIRLSVERQGDEVLVTVTDNGIGIPAEMQKQIFEMFTQIDGPLERGSTGLGIGLTLVKMLVELHGGSIRVRSDGPHQGSEFQLRLPVLTAPVRKVEAPRPDDAQHARTSRRVLVVDDNEAAADLLSMVVKMLGNEVRTARDGEQAIRDAEEFRPDVILMDLGMPVMNGFDAAKHIRQQPWGKGMVLVALTGWGQDEDKQRTKAAGFDHHVVKPAEPAALQQLFADLENSHGVGQQ